MARLFIARLARRYTISTSAAGRLAWISVLKVRVFGREDSYSFPLDETTAMYRAEPDCFMHIKCCRGNAKRNVIPPMPSAQS